MIENIILEQDAERAALGMIRGISLRLRQKRRKESSSRKGRRQ
jgi:hypothetical protein